MSHVVHTWLIVASPIQFNKKNITVEPQHRGYAELLISPIQWMFFTTALVASRLIIVVVTESFQKLYVLLQRIAMGLFYASIVVALIFVIGAYNLQLTQWSQIGWTHAYNTTLHLYQSFSTRYE